MLIYVRTLEFEEKPDYSYMKSLVEKAMKRENITMDLEYMWRK